MTVYHFSIGGITWINVSLPYPTSCPALNKSHTGCVIQVLRSGGERFLRIIQTCNMVNCFAIMRISWLVFILIALLFTVSPSGVDLTIMGMYEVAMQVLGTSITRYMMVMPDPVYQARTKLPAVFIPNVTCQGEEIQHIYSFN